MKLINKTAYDTRTLRKLMTMAHNRLAKTWGRRLHSWKQLKVVVEYTRGRGFSYVSGRASYSGFHMALRLPAPRKAPLPPRSLPASDVLWLMTHELYHSYGYHHKDFPPHIMHNTTPERFKVPGLERLSPQWPKEQSSTHTALPQPHTGS